jgi:hypothetical protein
MVDKELRLKEKELLEDILDAACETISEMKKGDMIVHAAMAELLNTRYPSSQYRTRKDRLRGLLINRHQIYLNSSYNKGYVLAKDGAEHEAPLTKIRGAVGIIENKTDEIVKISPEGKTRAQQEELMTIQQTTGRFAERVKSSYRDLVRKNERQENAVKKITHRPLISIEPREKELQI